MNNTYASHLFKLFVRASFSERDAHFMKNENAFLLPGLLARI
jgi:hypothetical protein